MRKFLIPAAALLAFAGGTALVAQMPTAAPGAKDVAGLLAGDDHEQGIVVRHSGARCASE